MSNPRPLSVLCLLLALTWAQAALWADPPRSPLEVLRASGELVHQFNLANGMTGLLKRDDSAPVAAVQIWVGTGSIHEGESTGGGLSHYLEHMLFKGTTTRSASEVSKAIDEIGGTMNAYTSFDRTVYHVVVPRDALNTGFQVLADIVQHATIPEDEWERERDVVFQEVAMGQDDPDRVISKLLFYTAYRVHPYRHPVIGYEDLLQTMSREDLLAYYHQRYVPQNMTVVIVGDIDITRAEKMVRETFSTWPRKRWAPVFVPAEPPQTAPRHARETRPVQLTRIRWAYPSVALTHPDAAVLDVLSFVLGRGRSARVFKDLVEEKQVAVNAEAWSYTPADPGLFAFSLTCQPDQEAKLLEALQSQINSWKSLPFTQEELDRAKRQLLVQELSNLLTVDGQATYYGMNYFYTGSPSFGEQYLEQVESVTLADLNRVVDTWLRPERRILAVLSPKSAVDTKAITDTSSSSTPALHRMALDQGITLLVREDPRMPFTALATASRGGLLAESQENNGITQLMAHLLTRGTPTRSAENIARAVESRGATLDSYSGRNSFGITAQFLSEDLEFMVALISDCLLHPIFPEDEIEKSKVLQIAERSSKEEQPMFLARQTLLGLLHPSHPYALDPTGTKESIGSVTPGQVHDHYQRLCGPSNLVVSLCGDITSEAASNLVANAFADLTNRTPALLLPQPTRAKLPARAKRSEPREQAIVLHGYPGVDILDPRSDALNILQEAMSGLASELMIEIRDKRGLAYFAGAYNMPGLIPGNFVLYCGTRQEEVDEIDRLLTAEANRVTGDKLEDQELDRARRKLINEAERNLQNNLTVAQSTALDALYGLDPARLFHTRERLTAISNEDIRRAARDILKPEAQAVSIFIPKATHP